MKTKRIITPIIVIAVLISVFLPILTAGAESINEEVTNEEQEYQDVIDTLNQEEYELQENVSMREQQDLTDVHLNRNSNFIRLLDCPQIAFSDSIDTLPENRMVYYQIDGYIINLVSNEEWIRFQESVLDQLEDFETMPLVKFIQFFNISRETLEVAVMQMHEARAETINSVNEMMQEEQARIIMEITHTEISVDPEVLEQYNASIEMSVGESSVDARTGHRIDSITTLAWPWYDPFADPMHEVNEIPNLDIIFTFDNDIINRYYRR